MVRAGFGNVRGKAASLLGTLLFAALAVLRQGRADSFWWNAASGDFHAGANWTPSDTPPGCGSNAGRYDVASVTNGGEVAISDASLLDSLLATVSRVPSVYDARRIMPGEGANQMKQRV